MRKNSQAGTSTSYSTSKDRIIISSNPKSYLLYVAKLKRDRHCLVFNNQGTVYTSGALQNSELKSINSGNSNELSDMLECFNIRVYSLGTHKFEVSFTASNDDKKKLGYKLEELKMEDVFKHFLDLEAELSHCRIELDSKLEAIYSEKDKKLGLTITEDIVSQWKLAYSELEDRIKRVEENSLNVLNIEPYLEALTIYRKDGYLKFTDIEEQLNNTSGLFNIWLSKHIKVIESKLLKLITDKLQGIEKSSHEIMPHDESNEIKALQNEANSRIESLAQRVCNLEKISVEAAQSIQSLSQRKPTDSIDHKWVEEAESQQKFLESLIKQTLENKNSISKMDAHIKLMQQEQSKLSEGLSLMPELNIRIGSQAQELLDLNSKMSQLEKKCTSLCEESVNKLQIDFQIKYNILADSIKSNAAFDQLLSKINSDSTRHTEFQQSIKHELDNLVSKQSKFEVEIYKQQNQIVERNQTSIAMLTDKLISTNSNSNFAIEGLRSSMKEFFSELVELKKEFRFQNAEITGQESHQNYSVTESLNRSINMVGNMSFNDSLVINSSLKRSDTFEASPYKTSNFDKIEINSSKLIQDADIANYCSLPLLKETSKAKEKSELVVNSMSNDPIGINTVSGEALVNQIESIKHVPPSILTENYEYKTRVLQTTFVSSLIALDGIYVSGDIDGIIQVRDGKSHELISKAQEGKYYVFCFCNPKPNCVISGSSDNCVKIWNIDNSGVIKLQKSLKEHTDYVISLLSLKEGVFCSGSRDKTIIVWDLARLSKLYILKGHENYVWGLGLVPKFDLLISVSMDNTLRLWSTLDFTKSSVSIKENSQIFSTCVIGDNMAAVGLKTGAISIWNLSKKQRTKSFKAHSNIVRGMLVIDDKILVTYSNDFTIKIWDNSNYELLNCLKEHTNVVYSIIFLGTCFISGSKDSKLRIWE